MAQPEAKPRWWPIPSAIISAAIALIGIGLTSLSWWFLLLVGAAALGPGILRELGWLNDQDEYQQQVAYRAGFHAYLVAGLVAFVLIAYVRSGERELEATDEFPTMFLVLMWFVWFLSSLISYWGIQKAAFRILLFFGCAWLLFAIASNVGSEWNGWASLLLSPLLALPFFLLAWLSKRWPRVAGILLIATSIFLFQFFGIFQRDHLAVINQAFTLILFIGPLMANGVTLLFGKIEPDDSNETFDEEQLED